MYCLVFILCGVIACSLSSCSSSVDASKAALDPVVSGPVSGSDALERRIATSIETYRKAKRLKPIAYHPKMAKMARKHSEYLMRQYLRSGKRSLNHDGSGGRSNTMLYSMGMRKTSENVAYIWGDAGDVAMRFSRDWINSKKHKFNILGHWDFTGVGIAKCPDGTIFATQLFALEDDFENF